MPKANVNTTQSMKNTDTRKPMTEAELDQLAKKAGKDMGEMPKKLIFLPIIDKSDMVQEICINGYIFLIQRGKKVNVPYAVYLLLQQVGLI